MNGGVYDKTDGTLYLIDGMNLVAFSDGDAPRAIDYNTKRFRFPVGSVGAVRVLAQAYPVALELTYPEIPATDSISVTSSAPHRVSNLGLVSEVEARIQCESEVTAIMVASTIGELPL